MYIVTVVRVKRDKSLVINLAVGRFCYTEAVAVACKRAGCIAGFKLSSLGDNKFKNTVRNEDNRFGKAFVKLHFNVGGVGKLKTNFVAGLVLAVITLVNLVAESAERNVAVCSY